MAAEGTLARAWRSFFALGIGNYGALVTGLAVNALLTRRLGTEHYGRLALMLMFSLVIAVAMKIVGVLLITALLVIPAATARRLAKNPEHMMALAVVFGFIAVAGGLSMSWYLDSPAGPSVVVTAFLSFLLVYGAARKNSH